MSARPSTDAPLIVASADEISTTDTAGAVAAAITLDNANSMTAAGEQFIADSSTVMVRLDMQKVEATSVAVAVALAWLAAAAKHGKELCLSNLSSDFSGVIEFSGITSMFAEHISAGAAAD